MSYEPFHLKYRPRIFSDVVGQEAVATTLCNALRDSRVANAFLFAGSRGVGKTSMARILAKALNCPQAQGGEPCGICETCTSIAGGHDIDVIEVDGASNRGIDEIRAIRDNVGYAPSKARFKVYIIDEVHMLTPQAFNALLKTLEEPPRHVKFVFATTEPQQVLETIISRCQRYEFRRISIDDIIGRLQWICGQEGITAPGDVLTEIATKAEGGLRDSVSLLDQLVAFAGSQPTLEDLDRVLGRIDTQVLQDIVDPAGSGDPGPLMDALDSAFDSGRDAEEVLTQLTELFREAMVRDARGLPGGGEGRRAALVACVRDHFPLDRLLFAVRICLNTRREMKLAGQSRLQLELGLLKIARSRDLMPIKDLLARLQGAPPAESVGRPGVAPVRRPEPRRAAPTPRAPSPAKVPAPRPEAPPRASPPPASPPPETQPAARASDPAAPQSEENPVQDDSMAPALQEEPRSVPAPPPAEPVSRGAPQVAVVKGEWGKVVDAVRAERPRAAPLVNEAVPEQVEGDVLTLRLPPGGDFKKRQLEGGLRRLVEKAIADVFGHPMQTVYFVPTVAEERKRPRETKVYEDPGVRRILDSFGGDVISMDESSGDTDTHDGGR